MFSFPFKHWLSALTCGLLLHPYAAGATPYISEFMADNETTLADEEGDFPDWIEIHNPDDVPIRLGHYSLTDDSTQSDKWTFPDITLEPGDFLIVFASGKNRRETTAPLHTNFQLAANGEYLAMVDTRSNTLVSVTSPSYPPQFEDESYGVIFTETQRHWHRFSSPTPGRANEAGDPVGPTLEPERQHPPQPDGGPMSIGVKVHAINAPISEVHLHYLKMYERERRVVMHDDGLDGDALAGDGIWTATIPENAFHPGEMTRWRFTAEDEQGNTSREPAYRDRRDSNQYHGTVTKDSDIHTLLPVLHWFTRSASGAGTPSGSRGSLYYQGEFYDNVYFNRHGQSSADFPKKSYNIDFNRTQRFRWNDEAPRVADIDLLTNWADKSKVRHVLAYEVMRESGVAAHFAHTIRVQQNGAFFSTADLVEDADDIYLERAGLNPDGALYKVYANRLNKDAGDNARSGIEKKNRKFEDNSDLQALIDGLDLRGSALSQYMYDNIDIPSCVNLLAANSVIRNIDMHSKNWYIYRDTGLTDEWAILPWDLDLSHGRIWTTRDRYFDNRLYTDGFVSTGTAIRLVSHMFSNPGMRAMIMRRIRTLSDQFLQAPPGPDMPESERYYERRLNEQLALIDPPEIVPSDARMDFEKWGSWTQGGTKVSYRSTHRDVETMVEAIDRWKTEYLPARRNYIYNTQIIGRGGQIPLPQSGGGPTTNYVALVKHRDPVKVLVPRNGDLGDTWTGHPSREPFDVRTWRTGRTGVGYDRGTAYDELIELDVASEMRSNTSVYMRLEFDLDDLDQVEMLELRMKYDDGFVAYLNGDLLLASNAPDDPEWNDTSIRPHTAHPRLYNRFDVTDKQGSLREGRNILAIHGLNDALDSRDMLIVPELHIGRVIEPTTLEPIIQFGTIESSPASGNQDEEYVEFINNHEIAVDMSNWELTGGIRHVFAPGTVLPPNGSLILSPDVTAFRAREDSPKGGEGRFVQGGYNGHLSNFGETLTLLDASGTVNNSTQYVGNPSEVQQFLVISELMYHPSGNNLAEFVELLNISETVSLDLSGVQFTEGIHFDFTEAAVTSLAPGERVLVVRDLATFQSTYGVGHTIAGTFADGTALSNGGERIKLEDASNGTIAEFEYDDRFPWPVEADQSGHSLVLVNPTSRPDPALAANWRASIRPGGTPGSGEGAIFTGDPSGDADGNGVPDLIDFAMGNDLGLPPRFPSFQWEAATPDTPRRLLLSIPKSLRAEGILFMPLFSTDLMDWQAAPDQLVPISTESLGDGRVMQVWEIKPPLSDDPRLFMRLSADLP